MIATPQRQAGHRRDVVVHTPETLYAINKRKTERKDDAQCMGDTIFSQFSQKRVLD